MDTATKTRLLPVAAWTLGVATSSLAIVAWGQGISWQLNSLSIYQLFPLLGLVAFGLMWGHYVVATLRQLLQLDKQTITMYFEATSLVVLVLILLHPGLLAWQLWRDGFGLPPQSYLQHYVAPALRWVAVLGTVSLGAFLAFELRRWFQGRGWWKYVTFASDLAMVSVFYHGLKLGSNTQTGWFRYVWLFYGLSLAGILAYKYYRAYGIKKR